MRKAPRRPRIETTQVVFIPLISLLSVRQWLQILLAILLVTIVLSLLDTVMVETNIGTVLLLAVVAFIALKWRPILTFVRSSRRSSLQLKRRR